MLRHMYEHHADKLLPLPAFIRREVRHVLAASAIIGGALAIGMVGYHALVGLPWIDAFLNASMILSGMGPVDHVDGAAGKLFAGTYALFSGLVFIGVASLIAAPIVHRLLHRLHLAK